jgi:hypothetical protein
MMRLLDDIILIKIMHQSPRDDLDILKCDLNMSKMTL